jgi:hypothetical protein
MRVGCALIIKSKDVLPKWGPYSKKYMGISHVPAPDSLLGARFDCVVFPTVTNSGAPVPNVTVPSGYHPWNASGDMKFIEYRCELEWKDRMYADVSFSAINDGAVLIRTAFVNRTRLTQNCMLNYFCAMEYPDDVYCKPELPAKSFIWNAADYKTYDYAVPRPWDGQNPDGAKKGEFRDPLFVSGSGLGDRVDHSHVPQLVLLPFGAVKGDKVSYRVDCPHGFGGAVLGIRYRTCKAGGGDCVFRSEGLFDGEMRFAPSDGLGVAFFPVGKITPGPAGLTLTAEGGGDGIELDCLFITEGSQSSGVSFTTVPYGRVPEISDSGSAKLYRYPGVGTVYGLAPLADRVRCRAIPTGSLEDAMISRLSNPDPTFDDVCEPFTRSFSRKHTNEGFYHNTIIPSIYIKPGETHIEYAVVFAGSPPSLGKDECEALYAARREPESLGFTAKGKKYEFGTRLLKSTLLGNIVYPIYKHGKNIRHFTPGKRWDCLYTWDSGFIGLGLLEAEPKLAEYVLDTYLSTPDNPDYAFLFHGSPVPTHIYLYLELLNRVNDKSALLGYYPRARLYYEFLVGRTHGSTTARYKSGLTTTYDLFYSTSGMDDYPAQVYIHAHGLERSAAPCISASHAIRFAKILRMIADESGFAADSAEYSADIAQLTDALQKYAWDPDAGYFGYVLHNAQDRPTGIMRSESGENMNKGFDGLYPLIAGACTEQQKRILLGHISSPEEIFSPVGLSAVDMTSSYYIADGYWNGSVWFSHQWFFYKTMLDLGKTELAYRIAATALRIWKKEVEDSYNCFEMINIASGRGGWYHQFGGLSAPLAVWADAYYKPGTVTAGFDVWIKRREFNPDLTSCVLDLDYHGSNGVFAVTIVTADSVGAPREVTLNGRPAEYRERFPGMFELRIPGSCVQSRIEIKNA